MKFKEQITIKNIKHFPSMEWGEEGGTSADFYYKGKKVCHYVNYGDGGEEHLYWCECEDSWAKVNLSFEVIDAVRTCLKRLGLYESCIIKTEEKIIECDMFGFLIMHFEELKELEKYYKKELKRNKYEPMILYALFTEHFTVKQALKYIYNWDAEKLAEEYEKVLFFRYAEKFKKSRILQRYVIKSLDFFKEI